MIRLALILLLLAACNRAGEPPAQTTAAAASTAAERPNVDIDAKNLLSIANGAAVVSRTGELDLETSALHAIDSMRTTRWTSPPGDASQTLIYSFGAPVRVNQLGFTTHAPAHETPQTILFSASPDGRTWRQVLMANPKVSDSPHMHKVDPFEALYLRVELLDPKETFSHLISVHAHGEEIYPPELKSFDGCWTINGQPAQITQRGARITGVIQGRTSTEPLTVLDGGIDGRVARVMWMRGAQWGYAAITLSADQLALSGLTFHQNPLTGYVARAWFGQRCDEGRPVESAPPVHFLNRSGQWTMSGLAFDDREQLVESLSAATLDELLKLLKMPDQRFRITAHEFRYSKEENRQRTVARIASLRAALDARGVDWSRIQLTPSGDEWSVAEPVFAVQRLLWSRIDLQLQ